MFRPFSTIAVLTFVGLAGATHVSAADELHLAQAKPRQEVVFACEFDTRDEILGHICRRASLDAQRAGAVAGLSVQVAEPNSVSGIVFGRGEGFVQLTLHMEATSPASQFGQKEIVCTLAGKRIRGETPYIVTEGKTDPADWSVSFEATGVPRDLVHPVADSVAAEVEGFFARLSADRG